VAAGSNVDLGDLLELRRRVERARPFLDAAGKLMVNRSQRAFADQGRPAGSWPERGVPNVYGIVQDLKRGGRPKLRRFRARPAGVDTNTLSRSITYSVRGNTRIAIGSALTYAQRVQEGGASSMSVPRSIKAPLYKFLRTSQGKRWRGSLGFLFTFANQGRNLSGTIPARPFLDVLPEDESDIGVLWERWLERGRA
jgi:phage gpG-like protein